MSFAIESCDARVSIDGDIVYYGGVMGRPEEGGRVKRAFAVRSHNGLLDVRICDTVQVFWRQGRETGWSFAYVEAIKLEKARKVSILVRWIKTPRDAGGGASLQSLPVLEFEGKQSDWTPLASINRCFGRM